jgi:hypothetical protein
MQRNVILALFGVAVLVLAPGPAFHTQAPSRIDQVPVFQGAFLIGKGEANAGEGRRVYTVNRPIEEVVAFYRQRLGGVPVPSADELTYREHNARETLRPGSVSPVWMLTRVPNLGHAECWPPKSTVEMGWLHSTGEGDLRFRIVITDETPDAVAPDGALPRTSISVSVSGSA